MHEKIQTILDKTIHHVLTSPDRHTRRTYHLLSELNRAIAYVPQYTDSSQKQVTLFYDLLLINTCKIEQIYQERTHVVNTLLSLLDECYQHADMPETVKMVHPYRYALMMHRHLKMHELSDLARLGYARIATLFKNFPEIGMIRSLKMFLGNTFSGINNLNILAELHPLLTELTLPFGKLKKERDDFINAMITRIVTYPKINNALAVHTFNHSQDAMPNLDFDFVNILQFINIVSDARFMKAMGDTPDSLDVQVIHAKTQALKDCRIILSKMGKAWFAEALHNRQLLNNHLRAIFTQLVGLQSIYTWGKDLDIAMNGLAQEVQAFSQEMLRLLVSPSEDLPQEELINRPDWQVANILVGPITAVSSLMRVGEKMTRDLLPRIAKLLKPFISSTKYTDTFDEIKNPLDAILHNAIIVIEVLEKKGIYSDVTQGFLKPCREHLLTLDVLSFQQMISIFRDQLEPLVDIFVESNKSADKIWEELGNERKNEIILNMAKLMFCAVKNLESFLPFISLNVLDEMGEALKEDPHAAQAFDLIRENLIDFQIVLMNDIHPLIQNGVEIFQTSGPTVTLGAAVKATSGSSAGKVLIDGTMNFYRLELGCIPEQMGIKDLPDSWNGCHLKEIIALQLVSICSLIDNFTLVNPRAHSALKSTGKLR